MFSLQLVSVANLVADKGNSVRNMSAKTFAKVTGIDYDLLEKLHLASFPSSEVVDELDKVIDLVENYPSGKLAITVKELSLPRGVEYKVTDEEKEFNVALVNVLNKKNSPSKEKRPSPIATVLPQKDKVELASTSPQSEVETPVKTSPEKVSLSNKLKMVSRRISLSEDVSPSEEASPVNEKSPPKVSSPGRFSFVVSPVVTEKVTEVTDPVVSPMDSIDSAISAVEVVDIKIEKQVTIMEENKYSYTVKNTITGLNNCVKASLNKNDEIDLVDLLRTASDLIGPEYKQENIVFLVNKKPWIVSAKAFRDGDFIDRKEEDDLIYNITLQLWGGKSKLKKRFIPLEVFRSFKTLGFAYIHEISVSGRDYTLYAKSTTFRPKSPLDLKLRPSKFPEVDGKSISSEMMMLSALEFNIGMIASDEDLEIISEEQQIQLLRKEKKSEIFSDFVYAIWKQLGFEKCITNNEDLILSTLVELQLFKYYKENTLQRLKELVSINKSDRDFVKELKDFSEVKEAVSLRNALKAR